MKVGKKKNVVGARFTNQFGPDNQTNPLREPLRLRFDDCRSKWTAINLWHKRPLASPDLLRLFATANMQRRNTAAQIFKTNVCKTVRAHHARECLLIRKP